MLARTVSRLKCPKRDSKKNAKRNQRHGACAGALQLAGAARTAEPGREIRSGRLECERCRAGFPILGGVAIVVDDVRGYLIDHVKGIARQVPDREIPREYSREYQQAKAAIQREHIEEDLEAERVNALYLMNHYLRVGVAAGTSQEWWKPLGGEGSPLIDSLVRAHWDQGPFHAIREWVVEDARNAGQRLDIVELGCGVGGLLRELKPAVMSYLGMDFSFASIALARHLALGAPYRGKLSVPSDLIEGPLTRPVEIPADATPPAADFVVGEFDSPPLTAGDADVVIALNMIDMLENPADLPSAQRRLLRPGGQAIQSSPYVWHEQAAKRLRLQHKGKLPVTDSAQTVEDLYTSQGFAIRRRLPHLPWLFLKHPRQLEVYSTHLLAARLPR